MSTPRHRLIHRRSFLATLSLLLLGTLVLSLAPSGGPAQAASVVPKTACKRFDANLVNGICLKYAGRSGTGYSWIGSYRADNGKVFFCIDYLYDSRIVSSAAVVSTDPLPNQFGTRIGDAEVAALNYLISTYAPGGSTGRNQRDAAIALIVREVMSDATRPDGTVVYRPGLKVGGTVAAPVGGLPGPMLREAQRMWNRASVYRGSTRLVLRSRSTGPVELGDSAEYRVGMRSAARRFVPGLRVTFTCTGPIVCPRPITTRTTAVAVTVRPTALGRATLQASASAPAADGKLLKLAGWRTHSGSRAQPHGVQRGWIAQRNSSVARASVQARIVKGTPAVTTRTSSATAAPGTALTDLVTVSGLPAGSKQQVTATLFGPLAERPGPTSCTDAAKVGQVTFDVDRNGDYTTPSITLAGPGYYVWTESMPGDALSEPVTTACGIVTETTVVRAEQRPAPPVVHTLVSAQHATVGGQVHDTVLVRGVPARSAVRVRWELLGPGAPRDGSCAGLDWSAAPTVAHGSFLADRDGRYRTPSITLRAPGCVTFVESLDKTAATPAVHTRPGEPAETVLVTRRPVPVVPEIPSGPAQPGR